jgi:hypothetical protein
VRVRLAPGGVFGLNLAGSLARPFPRAIYRTVLEVFPHAWAFAVPGSGNLLVLATEGESPNQEEMARRAAALDRELAFELPLSDVVARRVREGIDFTGTPVLSDRFAPVDRLLHLGREEIEIPGLPATRPPAEGE